MNKNDPDGLHESHWLLRAIVPGQVAWDDAVTAVEQGRYGAAAVNAVAMVGEQVATVLTGGLGRAALGGRSTAAQRAAVANWRAAQRTSLQKSERSLLANVQEHKQKIAQYRANPESMDNKGILARARSSAERQQIINGRLNALQKQLVKNQNELQKVREQLRSLQ